MSSSGPSGTRREKRVAAAPQDTRRPAGRFTEPPQQRRLPDAGLAADEHEAPARTTPHRPQALLERRELTAAFQQLARGAHGVARRSVSHQAPIVAPPLQRDKLALHQLTAHAAMGPPQPLRSTTARSSSRREPRASRRHGWLVVAAGASADLDWHIPPAPAASVDLDDRIGRPCPRCAEPEPGNG